MNEENDGIIYLHYTGYKELDDGSTCGWGEILTKEEVIKRGLIKNEDIKK